MFSKLVEVDLHKKLSMYKLYSFLALNRTQLYPAPVSLVLLVLRLVGNYDYRYGGE